MVDDDGRILHPFDQLVVPHPRFEALQGRVRCKGDFVGGVVPQKIFFVFEISFESRPTDFFLGRFGSDGETESMVEVE